MIEGIVRVRGKGMSNGKVHLFADDIAAPNVPSALMLAESRLRVATGDLLAHFVEVEAVVRAVEPILIEGEAA